MAKFAVKQFALSTAIAGNTQTVTIDGFGTPTAAIFLLTEGTVNGTSATPSRPCYGFTDGVRQLAAGSTTSDNVATSNSGRGVTNDAVILRVSATNGTTNTKFGFNSFIANGVILDIDVAAPTAELATMILIQADNQYAGVVDLGTGTTAIDVTAPGFKPDIIFGISHGNAAGTLPLASASFNPGFGVWINDGANTQRWAGRATSDNLADIPVNSWLSDVYVGGQNGGALVPGGSLSYGLTLNDADSSGFSITPSISTGSDCWFYLAVKVTGMNLKLFNISIPTSGDFTTTTPNFQPDFGLIGTVVGVTARNTQTEASATHSITAFDGTEITTHGYSGIDTTGTSDENSYVNNKLALLKPDNSGLSLDTSGYTFNSTGWTFTITTHPVTNPVLGWALAVGDPIKVPAKIAMRRRPNTPLIAM